MFSNPKQNERNFPNSSLPYNQYTNGAQLQDKRSISPSTRPTNFAQISSYKTIATGSPQSQTNILKLTPLLEPQILLGQGISSRIITLMSANEGTLHFHSQANNVLQRYQGNDVAFVGIWGSQRSDKSFFYDRILNLCDVQGDKYVNMSMMAGSNSLLYFYQRPFIKDKLRIFFIDCKGYKNIQSLTKMQKNQLDILISICQVIIIIQQPNSENIDILQKGYQHINDSFNRLYIDRKRKKQQPSQISWPKSLFVLYNTTASLKKHKNTQQTQYETQLCQMFKDYNFSILHNKNSCSQEQIKTYTTITNQLDQLYSKNTAIIFKEIYNKIQPKSYLNIRYNGVTSTHILAQIAYTLNLHQNLYLPKTFHKAKRSIFSTVYNHHALTYLPKMKLYIPEQKSYSTDYLLKAFRNVRQQLMEQYYQTQNQITVKPSQDSLCIQYEKKLQEYIEQKQKSVLQVNYKKSSKQLKKLFSSNSNNQKQFQKIKQSFLQNKRNYDNNSQALYFANTIKSLLKSNMAKNNGKLILNNNNAPYILGSPQRQTDPQFILNNPNVINRLQPGQVVIYDQPQLNISPQKIVQKIVQYEQSSILKIQKQKQEAQIAQKRRILSLKQAQFRKLQNLIQVQTQQVNRQINRFKIQQKLLQDQIKSQQLKLRELRARSSQLQSNNSKFHGKDEGVIQIVKEQVQSLKRQLQSKLIEKQKAEKMQLTMVSPQTQVLQSQINMKRQQLQSLKKSVIINKPVNKSLGFGQAQRRDIKPRQANIRRVHGSLV